MKKFIYCVGLHREGGLNILNKFQKIDTSDNLYLLDERLQLKYHNKITTTVSKSIFSRASNLLNLSKKLKKDDHIIFLNGLPPIFKFRANVSVIFQNANLFREFYKISFLKWFFSKDFLRYLIFLFGKKNVNNWYVFSPISKKILKKNLKNYENIKILNIYDDYRFQKKQNNDLIEYDFIYPASYLGHKNHRMLINVLIILSKKNIFPKVIFTLDPTSLDEMNFYNLKKKYNLKLFNYYDENQKTFLKIYKKCKSLLFMSLNETIGLPLFEASKFGLYIIAPKLEYSDQFIKPDAQFDVSSESNLASIIENCLSNNFQNKLDKKISIPEDSIQLKDFIKKII